MIGTKRMTRCGVSRQKRRAQCAGLVRNAQCALGSNFYSNLKGVTLNNSTDTIKIKIHIFFPFFVSTDICCVPI